MPEEVVVVVVVVAAAEEEEEVEVAVAVVVAELMETGVVVPQLEEPTTVYW